MKTWKMFCNPLINMSPFKIICAIMEDDIHQCWDSFSILALVLFNCTRYKLGGSETHVLCIDVWIQTKICQSCIWRVKMVLYSQMIQKQNKMNLYSVRRKKTNLEYSGFAIWCQTRHLLHFSFLSVRLSLSIHRSGLSASHSVCVSVCFSIRPSVYLSLSVCLPVCIWICCCLWVRLCIHLSVHQAFCVSCCLYQNPEIILRPADLSV